MSRIAFLATPHGAELLQAAIEARDELDRMRVASDARCASGSDAWRLQHVGRVPTTIVHDATGILFMRERP